MIKLTIIAAIAVATLSGCANNNTLSGDTFSSSQAGQAQTVTYGTLVSVRPVTIQGGDGNNIAGAVGGAVVGGFLGNTIGGGTGRRLGTAAGAVAGGVVGQQVQSMMNRSNGVELEVRRDNGTTFLVVQAQGVTQFHAGQRVTIATHGNTVTITPR
ncbi:glycine zipper 2TM domain-containing protein [Yersinia massiliensis]|jgi:outer membrane lipoprotein SlyB|uniref:Glycine zipper 2TM domain-containing protein n=2 Tax=Yersinia TaxID=629 RepID=A0A2R4NKU9_9GAMM|nr:MULTISPECIES: glycine zipper 2TM domain-containing protein [Yersinia]HEI6966779.1 glycine zipper 2TM domain-containing protein [Yersinia enterocolitica]ATM87462.1 glycine zipper 2TM domain-containing protein [Yersinia frederiksenii]AVX36734.1 glycine zipper 2TM domain-containing protein [Yersinia massiliensis]MCB5319597.1 glycine zipper 2TM domain-containing protein [Yersinia massiliensis]MDA5549843.1 glycine zipper 2TM domain-containing protein [Yersinia massiliensis]